MKDIKYIFFYCFILAFPNLLSAQIFNTDVKILGSLCVGIDCTTGESFGSDTQRFKENNLRIHFDDTSNDSNFASNDWRIAINSQDIGGGSYFAIEDATAGNTPFRIEAGAGANALHVDASGGNVGMGTENPVVELHVADGDSPTIRLEQNDANGWVPQTWDIAGNETNFFVRDVTNGSKLPFKIKPNAPDNSLFINASGKVTLGSQNEDDEKLTVRGNIALSGDIHFKNGTGTNDDVFKLVSSDTTFMIQDAATTNNIVVVKNEAPTNSLFIHDSGAISIGTDVENRKLNVNGGLTVNGDIYALSDKRLKRDITEIKYGLSDIMKLSAKQYNFNNTNYPELNLSKDLQLGLIAQEVQKVIPEVVTDDIKTKNNKGDITTLKGVNYPSLIPVLIQAIQDQQLLIDEKDSELAALKAQMDQMSAKVDMMMSYMGKDNVQQSSTSSKIDQDEQNVGAKQKPSTQTQPEVKMNNGRSVSDIKNKKKEKGN